VSATHGKRCCAQEYFAAKLTSYAPLQLGTPEYADALNISSTLGAKDSTQRTPYQNDTAFFWEDGDGVFFDHIDRMIQARCSRCTILRHLLHHAHLFSVW
jgi:hypothetical protein